MAHLDFVQLEKDRIAQIKLCRSTVSEVLTTHISILRDPERRKDLYKILREITDRLNALLISDK